MCKVSCSARLWGEEFAETKATRSDVNFTVSFLQPAFIKKTIPEDILPS
jgi:hypothetical protein